MNKKVLKIIFFVFLFFVSVGISYIYNLYGRVYIKPKIINIGSKAKMSPTPTPDPLAPKNILLLGYGGAGHEGGTLSDTMIVAHVIPKQKQVVLISIPRDIWINLEVKDNSFQKFKINHAFAIGNDDKNYKDKPEKFTGEAGGGNMAKDAVGKVIGMPIDYFVSINFDSFKRIVDNLGGVDVNVPYTFTDNFYPIKGEEKNTCDKSEDEIKELTATMSGLLLEQQFTCRYEVLHFDRGQNHMDGETALKFVRSRHAEIGGSDFGRAQRQQAFLSSVKTKLLSFSSIPKLIPVINTISRNVTTDINISTGLDILKDQGLSDVKIDSITLTTENVLKETYSTDRQYILIPSDGDEKWEGIHFYINSEIERLTSKSSPTPTSLK